MECGILTCCVCGQPTQQCHVPCTTSALLKVFSGVRMPGTRHFPSKIHTIHMTLDMIRSGNEYVQICSSCIISYLCHINAVYAVGLFSDSVCLTARFTSVSVRFVPFFIPPLFGTSMIGSYFLCCSECSRFRFCLVPPILVTDNTAGFVR